MCWIMLQLTIGLRLVLVGLAVSVVTVERMVLTVVCVVGLLGLTVNSVLTWCCSLLIYPDVRCLSLLKVC